MFTRENFDRMRSMADVYAISPLDCEYFCKFLLEHLGFQSVFVSKKYGENKADRGIDLTCIYNNQNVLVQCKKWRFGFNGHMKIAPIRELGGCMLRDKIQQGIFISMLLDYDQPSKIEAAKMSILLIGPTEIANHMRTINPRFNVSTKRSFIWRSWSLLIKLVRLVLGIRN